MDCGDNEPPSVRSCRQKSGIFTKHFTNGIPGGKASREFIFDKTECSDENQSSDGCSSCFTTSDDDSLGSFVVSDSDTLVFDSDDDSDSSHMPVVKARRSGRIYSDSESETEEKKTLSPTYIISDAESDEIKEMETNSIPKIPTLHALSEESHTQTGRRTVSKHSPTGTTMATSLNQMRLKDDTIIILLSLRPREEYHKAAEELGIKVFALDAVEVIERITGPRTLSAINEALHEMSLNQVSRYLKMAEKRKPILLDFCPIRTIAVEGLYGFYNGELTGRDITGYKLDWEHEWLPLLEETGYNIVVLADMADASAKVRCYFEL